MRYWLASFLTAACLIPALPGQAATERPHNDFVRTANYFLMSGPVLDQGLETLSTFDLLVIPAEAQLYNKSFFTQIRDRNPNIRLLAYVPTVSWNDRYWTDPLHQSQYAGIQSSWWLKDASGASVSIWPGTRALDLSSGWVDYLPSFVNDTLLSTGLWDGVFYDEVTDRAEWKSGYVHIVEKTRQLVGEAPIIITNGSSDDNLAPHVNGRMFETFPSTSNSLSEWKHAANDYLHVQTKVEYEPTNIINVNTENRGGQSDYQKMRFGLTTTLLGNGYFGFDFGTQDHSQLWTYDEYHAYLGAPKSRLQATINPQQPPFSPGLWQREYEQGKVIVNATETPQTVELNGDFEKLHGTQDRSVNDGSIVSEITLQAKDGIILLRPIESIVEATYVNGSFARVFGLDGKTKRTGFFAYNKSVRGGMQVVQFDLDHDGLRETITADTTFVSIYTHDNNLRARFAPYTEAYKSGVNISVGDLEDDGRVEIVTGTENGGGPQVRVFNHDGVLINPGFFAYAKSFRGGVNVAIGDLNGDHVKEIITGAGVGGGPHVRMFKKDGTLINPGFFAFDPSFRGGTNVASADVDGDGIDEVITAPGLGGKAMARVFDRNGHLASEFVVQETDTRRGTEITASDLDGDGIAEIIGLSADVFTLSSY